jgi:hypothetical protein
VQIDRLVVFKAHFQRIKHGLAHGVCIGVGKCKVVRHILGELKGYSELSETVHFFETDFFLRNGFEMILIMNTEDWCHALIE